MELTSTLKVGRGYFLSQEWAFSPVNSSMSFQEKLGWLSYQTPTTLQWKNAVRNGGISQ